MPEPALGGDGFRCTGLAGCRRVALVNTGTSAEAVASAVARLADGRDVDCFVLLTTEGSREAAGSALKIVKDMLRDVRVVLDHDACGDSVYRGLLDKPSTVFLERLRSLARGVSRSAGSVEAMFFDITGGVKLEAMLLGGVAYWTASTGCCDVFVSYSPGQGFARQSPWRLRGGAGWWGGRAYPETPRSLQGLILLDVAKSDIVQPDCRPGRLRAPRVLRLGGALREGLVGLLDAVADATRLLNASTCSEARIRGPDGRVLAVIDWAGPGLKEKPDPERLGIDDRGAVDCLKSLVVMATSVLFVTDSSSPAYPRGRHLSELLVEAWRGRAREDLEKLKLVIDTNTLYYGLFNTMLAAETEAVLRGVRLAGGTPLRAPSCIREEIGRKLFENAKDRVVPSRLPCVAAAAAMMAALGLAEKVSSPWSYCDLAVYELAGTGGVAVTGDKGVVNTLRAAHKPYLLVTPASPPDNAWGRHARAAAAAQLVLYMSSIAPCGSGSIVLEGDSASYTLCMERSLDVRVSPARR